MKRNIFLSVLLALSFCSCTKNIQEETVVYVDVPFYATLGETDDAESKTTLDTATGKVRWSVGDTIRLYSSYYRGLSSEPLVESDILGEGNTAKFVFSIPEDEVGKVFEVSNYLFYGQQNPDYLAQGSSTGKITGINLPAVQKYTSSGFGENENVAIGYCPAGEKSCVLKNIFGILKVHIALDQQDQMIEYVQLKDNGSTYLAGNFKLTGLENGTPTLEHDTQSKGGDSRTVDKRIPLETELSGGDFYFMIPPGTLANGFDVLVYTRSGYYGGKRITFASGTSIQRSAITSINIEVKGKPAPVPTYSKTANSYIFGVPDEGGVYTIQAQYGGNGYQGNGVDVAARSCDLGTEGRYADFLWQTKCNGDDIEGTDIVSAPTFYRDENNKGFITFRASGQKGNALLALKDGSGTILWSWHIWIVSQQDSVNIANGIDLANNAGVIMDRNLGALSIDIEENGSQTFGLAYQYGRKDPFLGSRALVKASDGSSYDDFMTMYPPRAIVTGNNEDFNMERSILEPYVRNMNSASRWCSDDVSWGAPHDPTSTGTESSSFKHTAKTLYDPCPVGWRTIEEAVVVDALGFENGEVKRPEGNVRDVGGGALAFEFTTLASESGKNVLFPAAGISGSNNSLENVGRTVAIWGASKTSLPVQTGALTSTAYYLQVALSKAGSEVECYTSDFVSAPLCATLPVRCVKWTEPGASTN